MDAVGDFIDMTIEFRWAAACGLMLKKPSWKCVLKISTVNHPSIITIQKSRPLYVRHDVITYILFNIIKSGKVKLPPKALQNPDPLSCPLKTHLQNTK